MKILLLVSFVAAAAAEADPYFYYGWGAAPYAYAGYHAPLVYSAASPCKNNEGAAVPCALGWGSPYLGYYPHLVAAAPAAAEDAAVEEARKKRDADPAVLAASTVVKTLTPFIHNPPTRPVVYAGGYGHHAYGLGGYGGYGLVGYPFLHHLAPAAAEAPAVEEARKKREAEAEAEADPWYFYSGLGYGHHYGYGYHPYTYAAPLVYAAPKGCQNVHGHIVPCA